MPIEAIDLTKAIPAGLLSYPAIVQAVLPDIAHAVRAEIIRLANNKLKTTHADYIAGVQPVKFHTNGKLPAGESTYASVVLVGQIANMVEHGWAGMDMKPALLKGRSARDTKAGPYAVIPFRHGAPGSSGRNFQAMGAAHTGMMGAEAARKMGKRIHRAASKLSAQTTHPSGHRSPGERLRGGMSPRLKAHHTTDIHEGMIRQRKTYRKATQSQYMTFRAVSKRSNRSSWIHPGYEGVNIFREAGEYASKVTGHLLQHALRGAS